MAELLNRWVNEDVGLSRRVLSFEADFASGFLLGELLYRFNQQKSFGSFQDSSTSDAKVANFILLEPTLRNMGIKFDTRTAQGERIRNFFYLLLYCYFFFAMLHRCVKYDVYTHTSLITNCISENLVVLLPQFFRDCFYCFCRYYERKTGSRMHVAVRDQDGN